MFDHASRYSTLDIANFDFPDGRSIAYVRRRFLPQGDDMPVLAEVNVATGERIDLLANRIYGDPLAFWRLCDANNAMDPLDMIAKAQADPGARLRAPLPQS
ncbi:MAG TPA: hypothetical protein VMU18_12180 [Rhodoblastus sp.]|nr:hypothetical protein [Rhodoblastus sp.]